MKFKYFSGNQSVNSVLMRHYGLNESEVGVYIYNVFIDIYKILLKWGPSYFDFVYEDLIKNKKDDNGKFTKINSVFYNKDILYDFYIK